MNEHLDMETLSGYLYRTLDDARRESIDEHLVGCPACREKLAQGEGRYQQISNSLAGLNHQAPSERMSYGALTPRLASRGASRRPAWMGGNAPALSTSLALTVAGLLLSVAGLWQVIAGGNPLAGGGQIGALPPLACFFFLMASVDGFERAAFTIQPRYALVLSVSGILWLGTAIIGIFNIFAFGDLAIAAVVALGGGKAEAGPAAMLAVLAGGVVFIIAVVGGADYHLKNLGQPQSWKVFSITLLVQLLILLLPYWIY
jgi:hypothetical protein